MGIVIAFLVCAQHYTSACVYASAQQYPYSTKQSSSACYHKISRGFSRHSNNCMHMTAAFTRLSIIFSPKRKVLSSFRTLAIGLPREGEPVHMRALSQSLIYGALINHRLLMGPGKRMLSGVSSIANDATVSLGIPRAC